MWVVVDQNKLEKVINNLFFNVFKFILKGGYIKFCQFDQEEILFFQVEDLGLGIVLEDIFNIFKCYY